MAEGCGVLTEGWEAYTVTVVRDKGDTLLASKQSKLVMYSTYWINTDSALMCP